MYENVFSLSHPSALASPAGIHVAYWANEERLFQLCSLLSMPKLGLKLRDDLFNLSISFDEGTAANDCLNTAFAEYKRNGGDPAAKKWLAELRRSATENAGDLIKLCFKSGKDAEACAKKAEEVYMDVVGTGSDGAVAGVVLEFDVVLDQAKTDAIKDALGPCVENAVASALLRAMRLGTSPSLARTCVALAQPLMRRVPRRLAISRPSSSSRRPRAVRAASSRTRRS